MKHPCWQYTIKNYRFMLFRLAIVPLLILTSLFFSLTVKNSLANNAVSSDCQSNRFLNSWISTPISDKTQGCITSFIIENISDEKLTNYTALVGHPFKTGDVPEQDSLQAIDDSGVELPLQVDVKAKYDDGSIKHAVLSVTVNLSPQEKVRVYLKQRKVAAVASLSGDLNLVLRQSELKISILDESKLYQVDLMAAVKAEHYLEWLRGPRLHEWIIFTELKGPSGSPHKYLSVMLILKSFASNEIQLDVVFENTYSFYSREKTPNVLPKNITYDWSIRHNGLEVAAGRELEHFAHARWRISLSNQSSSNDLLRVDPHPVNIIFDKKYLIEGPAVANYSAVNEPDESLLQKIFVEHKNSDTNPMGLSMIDPVFSSGVEGSIDAAWSVAYLLSGDYRARLAMLSNANAAGSIGIHFKDEQKKISGRSPLLSILTYPKVTIRKDSKSIPYFKGDTYLNRKSGNIEPIVADTAHQNSFAYLPYLLTGDYYYLQELHFWANYNLIKSNPGRKARNGEQGLVRPNSIRGQAWALRALSNAAYITPDGHPEKKYFDTIFKNNIDWYVANYTGKNPKLSNSLGLMTSGYNKDTGITHKNFRASQLWMDNWFTAVIGRIFEMGYHDIFPLLKYKSKVVLNLLNNRDVCYIFASSYAFYFRDGKGEPLYNWKMAYQETILNAFNKQGHALQILNTECGSSEMASLLKNEKGITKKLKAGQFLFTHGVSASYFGRLQGAVATVANAGIEGGHEAWNRLMSSTVMPNWNEYHKKRSVDNGNKYNLVPLIKP